MQPVAELRITVDRVKEGSKVGLEYEYDELPLRAVREEGRLHYDHQLHLLGKVE